MPSIAVSYFWCPTPHQGVDSPAPPILLVHFHLWRIRLMSMPWYRRQRSCEKLPLQPGSPLAVTGAIVPQTLDLGVCESGRPLSYVQPVCLTPWKDSGGPLQRPLFQDFCPGSSDQACLLPPRLDPSASLDFLWACIHVPRIWQGRDQRTPQAGLKRLAQPCGWQLHVLGLTFSLLIGCRSGGRSWCSMSMALSCSAWWN